MKLRSSADFSLAHQTWFSARFGALGALKMQE